MAAKESKNIVDMTTRELKKLIKKLVKKANTKLKNIGKRKKVSKAVEEEIEYLKSIGIIGKRGKAVTGYRLASKAELQKKARELTYFNQWKGSETVAQAKEKDYKKYESFKEHNPDFAHYSYQQWRDLVELFGAMGDELKSFDYEDMKQLHLEASIKNTKIDMVSAMKNVQRDKKGAGVTSEDLTDYARDVIFS